VRSSNRLRDAGLVGLVPGAEFEAAGGVVDGVFSVPKDADFDRFIVNAVSSNEHQWPPDKRVSGEPEFGALGRGGLSARANAGYTSCVWMEFLDSGNLTEGIPSSHRMLGVSSKQPILSLRASFTACRS